MDQNMLITQSVCFRDVSVSTVCLRTHARRNVLYTHIAEVHRDVPPLLPFSDRFQGSQIPSEALLRVSFVQRWTLSLSSGEDPSPFPTAREPQKRLELRPPDAQQNPVACLFFCRDHTTRYWHKYVVSPPACSPAGDLGKKFKKKGRPDIRGWGSRMSLSYVFSLMKSKAMLMTPNMCRPHTHTHTHTQCLHGGSSFCLPAGFSIKAVPFPNAILNVKELGGKRRTAGLRFSRFDKFIFHKFLLCEGKRSDPTIDCAQEVDVVVGTSS